MWLGGFFSFFSHSADRYGPARARTRVIGKQIYLFVFHILQLFFFGANLFRKKNILPPNNHHPPKCARVLQVFGSPRALICINPDVIDDNTGSPHRHQQQKKSDLVQLKSFQLRPRGLEHTLPESSSAPRTRGGG